MKALLFLFGLSVFKGGFLRYEFYERTDSLRVVKNASTIQFNISLEGEMLSGYGSINFIMRPDSPRFRAKPIEAYIRMRGEKLGFIAGKKIFSFGAAEFINPTDFLAPRDYTEIYGDIEEFKEGINAIEMDLYSHNWIFRFIGEPKFTPDMFPEHRISFTVPYGTLMQTFEFIPLIGALYDSTKGTATYTLRAEGYLSRFDICYTLHYGFDRLPDILYKKVEEDSTEQVFSLTPAHPRYYMAGISFVYPFGDQEFHLEGAYKRPAEDYNLPGIKNPEIFLILGLKHTTSDGKTSGSIEGGVKKVYNFKKWYLFGCSYKRIIENFAQKFFFQTREYEYYAIFNVSHKSKDEKIRFMLQSAYELKSGDYFLLPRLTYTPEDGVDLTIGGFIVKKDGTTAFTAAGKHIGNLILFDLRFYF